MAIANLKTLTLVHLLSALTITAELPVIHDLLPQLGLPRGLLPEAVATYSISSNGDFVVELTSDCYADFLSNPVFYKKRITDKISYGMINNISGIQAKESFYWVPVTGIEAKGYGRIELQVGVLSESVPVSEFEEVPRCKSKVGCLDGGSEEENCDVPVAEGKVPLLSLEARHQLHIFIFVLAITHVVLSVLNYDFRWCKEAVAMATSIPPPQPAAASFGASAITSISVDASLAGGIIGANTEHIRQVTGAKLSIRDNESDANLKDIELEGTFDQIQEAHWMVQELIMNPPPPMKRAAPASGKYKTRVCEKFTKGSCTLGDRCHLAHGAAELRKAAA